MLLITLFIIKQKFAIQGVIWWGLDSVDEKIRKSTFKSVFNFEKKTNQLKKNI